MRGRTLLVAAALLTLSFTGCLGDSDEDSLEQPDVGEGVVPFQTLAEGLHSGIDQRHTVVFEDEGKWERWRTQVANESDLLPEEGDLVDFDTERAIGVFYGNASSTCHGARVTEVTFRAQAAEDRVIVSQIEDNEDVDQGGNLTVHGVWFELYGPELECRQTNATPFHLIKLTKYAVDRIEFDMDVVTVQATDRPATRGPGNASGADRGDGRVQGQALQVDVIAQGQQSGVAQRELVVVRNQSAWTDLWQRHNVDRGRDTNGSSDDGPPEVDFSQSTVLAAFQGTSPNDCHYTEFSEVTLAPHGAVVAEGGYFTDAQDECRDVEVTPFHIIRIDVANTGVAFDWQGNGGS